MPAIHVEAGTCLTGRGPHSGRAIGALSRPGRPAAGWSAWSRSARIRARRPFIQALPDAVHAECRVATPAVRKSWLEGGPGANTAARGAEPFVAVSWDRALDLVAGELQRVRKEYGNEAIYGSSGWGSAGNFHNARSQLGRFLNLHGGFIDQVTSFSVGAASVIVPAHRRLDAAGVRAG